MPGDGDDDASGFDLRGRDGEAVDEVPLRRNGAPRPCITSLRPCPPPPPPSERRLSEVRDVRLPVLLLPLFRAMTSSPWFRRCAFCVACFHVAHCGRRRVRC